MSQWMAWIYEWMMAAPEAHCLARWRGELLGGLTGKGLEIGAGTGLNLRHYPAGLELTLLEPDAAMRVLLEKRLAEGGLSGASILTEGAERLPLADESLDFVVSTLVCCTVGDPVGTLAEIHRVLRPGGQLVFMEHVGAPAGTFSRRVQGLVEPVWKLFAGGCHLTRDTGPAIVEAGFESEGWIEAPMCRAPFFVRPTVRGIARKGGRI